MYRYLSSGAYSNLTGHNNIPGVVKESIRLPFVGENSGIKSQISE
jgi:hypothetical protein